MLFMKKFSTAALVLTVGFAMNACSDDPKPEEPTQPAATSEVPATPPSDGASAGALQTEPVYFAFDDYSLSASAQSALNTMADALKANAGAVVQIEGHCDERGSIEYNLALGERRANSVKNYLTQMGVDAGRLTTISYGEEKPAADGHDESAWGKNRRAEFVVTNR